MARIELRDCTILLKDGLSGTCLVAEAAPIANDTDCDVNTISLNTADTDLITVDANDLTVDAYFQPTRENAADDTNITVDNIILTADNETLTEAQPEYDPYNTKNIFIIKRFDRSQSLSRPLCFLDKAYLTPYGGMS